MPTPRLSDELAREALELVDQHGSITAAALALGTPRATLQARVSVARARGMHIDPAIRESMAAVGTGLIPALAWAKTKNPDGTSYSVLLKPANGAEDIADKLRTAFENIRPTASAKPPEYADTDLLTVYPIADAHIGMMAWGKETGEDYDTAIAAARAREWMARCVASSPASHTAVVLDVGDWTHADDQTNQTPESRHQLDTDTRHFKTMDVAISAMVAAVDLALAKHLRVIVRILPGNHDRTSFMAVTFALAAYYRNEPRVEVEKIPGEFFMLEWGNVMLAAHHGDKAKAQNMVLFMADQYAEAWGRTRHRFLFTGHLHHLKAQDIGGVQWEQLRAVTAKDAYAVSHAFSARAQLQGITFHRERGEIQRVKVGL